MSSTDTRAETQLEQLCIDTVRTLAMDAVQKANSGHPGTPMALAPLAWVLWTRHLRHDPAAPDWIDRDRFVLSAGHASMLLYALLYLSGYDLDLQDLKNFRQWESRTPGHPEYDYTPGVETTTGPLGQGFGNAVGFAIAEAHLAAHFNSDGATVVDHRTYFIASDGDLMEGVSHEAASMAGHFRLGKLIGFYDDNNITIEGETDLTYSDDAAQRFEAYGWHVQRVEDGNDTDALDDAIRAAKEESERPSLIIVRTHIGWGSPNRQGTAKAHGEPLGEEEVILTKRNLGWQWEEPFHVPGEALQEWRKSRERGAALRAEWRERHGAWQRGNPDLAAELDRRMRGELPDGWDADLPVFTAANGNVATRAASGKVLNAIARRVPELMGGSADLGPSTNTMIADGRSFSATDRGARNMHFGIREHGMGAVLNGMSLHGGILPYGATFLIFSDYMRPSIRLAALMERRIIYVFTHDSIGLGEDGPTHQPVETLAALRVIPNLTVIRPADAAEVVEAWRTAIGHAHGPVALALTRQKVPLLDRSRYASAEGVARGAYVLSDTGEGLPQVILLASGSEVQIALAAQERLSDHAIRSRVVSMPSMELFAKQPADYRDEVLPPTVRARVAIEAAHPMPWYRWVGDHGEVMGIERFGASAPFERIFQEFGLTPGHLADRAIALLQR
jgi:transketolase